MLIEMLIQEHHSRLLDAEIEEESESGDIREGKIVSLGILRWRHIQINVFVRMNIKERHIDCGLLDWPRQIWMISSLSVNHM